MHDEACEELQSNKAFAFLPVEALFDMLKVPALANLAADAESTTGAEVALALAESATMKQYFACGPGSDGEGGGETIGAEGLVRAAVEDDGNAAEEIKRMPPLLVSRAQLVEVLHQLGVGCVPESLKVINRVFSSFDFEMLDQLDVAEFCR